MGLLGEILEDTIVSRSREDHIVINPIIHKKRHNLTARKEIFFFEWLGVSLSTGFGGVM